MISPFGVFTSYQVNVDGNGNNILGDAANEPSISVDPTDGNKMVIGWRQFNSINSDFRQAAGVIPPMPAYTGRSLAFWKITSFAATLCTLADETGNFFYLSLQSDQAQSFFCDDVWRSINGGQTWAQGGPGARRRQGMVHDR